MSFVNPSKPAGLSPVRYLGGAKYVGKGQIYSILAADTNPYYPGDLVVLAGTGDASGIPNVTLATAGSPAIGVIAGVGTNQYGSYSNPNALNINYRPSGAAAVNYYVLVHDDPNIVFEVQEGGTGTNLTQLACGANVNFIYAAPAAGVVVSGTQLDNTSAPTTTSTLNLKILRLAPRIDNHFVTSPTTGGGAQKWWVLINNHLYRTGVTGV